MRTQKVQVPPPNRFFKYSVKQLIGGEESRIMADSFSHKSQKDKIRSFVLVVLLIVQWTVLLLSQSGFAYAQTLEWQRILNHEGSYPPGAPEENATDFAFSVAAESDGVYIAGRSHFDQSYYYSDSADSFLAKYDFKGNLVFDYFFPLSYKYDGANRVVVDGKNVYMTGLIGSDNPNYGDSYLIVFNESTSEYTFPITWGGSEYDWEGIDSITKHNHELYVVITYEHLRRSPPLNFITDWWNELRIVKYTSNLTEIWEKNLAFAPHTNNGGNIAVDGNGIYLAGDFERPFGTQSGSGNYSLVKLDFNGNFLWKSKYRNETDRYTEISGVALRDGHLYVTGVTGLNPTPNPGSYNWDYFVAKYDAASGKLVWDKIFATVPQSSVLGLYYPVHIALGTNGIYLSAGTTKSIGGGGNDDVSLIKLDFNGTSLWQEEWGGPKNDYVEGITAVRGDAYLTGITHSYSDGSGLSNAFLLKYSGPDTTAPIVDAGDDVVAEQQSHEGAQVTLVGSAVDDRDSNLTYEWREGSQVLGTEVTLTTIFQLGSHTLTLFATDNSGNTGNDTVTVSVVDTTAPDLSVSLSPNRLWPPNHRYVSVTATVTVSDACDATPTISLVSVTSNEPDDAKGLGDGKTINDVVIVDNLHFRLRAERAEEGTGRIYTVTYLAGDDSGNVAVVSAIATVPVEI